MDRQRLVAPGLWMLIVAPIVSAIRALLVVVQVDEPAWYWVGFALGGSLSGLGMLLLAVGTWQQAAFRWVILGAATAFVGHYGLPLTPLASMGPAWVQVGTGLALFPWLRWAPLAGGVAAIGSLARDASPMLGNLLLFAGVTGLFVAILLAARAPDMHSQD